jgi:hypothetical protein
MVMNSVERFAVALFMEVRENTKFGQLGGSPEI